MKKNKKWLSIVLAVVLALSTCTTAFTAFAAPADRQEVSDAIAALQTPADLTSELESKYQALATAEKEAIDVLLLHKLYNFCYQKNSNNKTAVTTALGDFTDEMKAGMTLGAIMQGKTNLPGYNVKMPAVIRWQTQAEYYNVYMKAWNDASDFARSVADLQAYVDKAAFFGEVKASTATSKKVPKYLTSWANNEKLAPEALNNIFMTEFKWSSVTRPYVMALKDSLDIYNSYMKNELTLAEFITAIGDFSADKLPNGEVVSIDGSVYLVYISSSNYVSATPNSVISNITKITDNNNKLKAYCELVMSTVIPEDAPSAAFNQVIASIKAGMASLTAPFNITYMVDNYPDAFAKYLEILGKQFYDQPEKEETAHEGFEEEIVDYQMGRPYGDIITRTLLPAVESIANNLVPDLTEGKNLKGLLEQMLFTNANVKPIVMLLSGIIVETSPEGVAEYFKQFKETVDLGERLAVYGTWDDVPNDFDWGVIPGDLESFLIPILSSSIIPVLVELMLYNEYEYDAQGNATLVRTGIYEQVVIPLLEAFGAEDIMTSEEFTLISEPIMKAYMDGASGMSIKQIFKPIMLVVDQLYEKVIVKLLEDPVGYLAKNLPNIVYHLEDGCIFDSIKALLTELESLLGKIEGVDQYLSLEGIFSALEPILDGAGIKISLDDIKKFGRLGKAETVPTVSMSYKTTIRVVGNEESVVRQLAKILEPIALDLLDKNLGMSFVPGRAFVKVEMPAYPHNGKMDAKVMNAMIGGFDELLGGFVSIKDEINNNLCTPEMASTIITELYKAIQGLDLSVVGLTIPVSPKQVAAMLTEDKYKDLAADLQMENWADVALTVKNGDTVFDQCDMGFKAGDRAGFVDCVVAALRPLVKLVVDSGLILNNGTESYGLYETVIIPVFEGIGLTPAVDSATYTDNFNKLIKKADPGAAYDYLLKTILAPVLGLLEDLETKPLDTLLGILPNLAYTIQYSEDLAFIGSLLANDDGVIDLAGLLNGLIGGLLPGFELPPISLDALASCGELKEKESMSALHDTYMTVEANKADAFVTVFYYIYDTLNYKENMGTLMTLIAGIDGLDPGLATMIDSLINDVFTAGKEEALCKLGSLLASDHWACPDGTEGENSATPDAGDSSLPAMAVLTVMFVAAAAIVLLRRKKKSSW